MIARLLAPLLALLLAACATVADVEAPQIGRLDSAPVGEAGLVSAADPRAAEAGAAILRQGGNATDAAIATMLALTVAPIAISDMMSAKKETRTARRAFSLIEEM